MSPTKHSYRREAWVTFVGVWDTVESVGLPFLGIQISSSSIVGDKRIAHVRHALSLDEQRLTFRPRIYNQPNSGKPIGERSLRQVWFRGVHSDVGGGYLDSEAGLSGYALQWMVEQAKECHLRCAHVVLHETQRKLHDTVQSMPVWALAGMTIRTPDYRATNASVEEDPSVGGSAAPVSAWDQWDARSLFLLNLSVALMVVGYCLQAIVLSADWREPGWGLPSVLAKAQLGRLLDPCASLAAAALTRPLEGNYGWAMAADTLIFLPGYALFVAFVSGWAYRTGMGLRRATESRPSWHWLGLAPMVLVFADVVENLLTAALDGWHAGLTCPQGGLNFMVGVAAAIKFSGLAGCALLALIALVKLAMRRIRPQWHGFT